MSIDAVTISKNPYAPKDADEVRLYRISGASGLTLGQLLCSVCLRAGALQESISVRQSNALTQTGDIIKSLSDDLDNIANGTVADWGTLKKELEASPYSITGLPGDINTFNNQMLAMSSIKMRLDLLNQQSQKTMIDLQTSVNRRDVAYTTSTNLIRALGQSKMNSAAVLTR